MTNVPMLGNILMLITPLLINLIVGFILGALLVFISLTLGKLSPKHKQQS
jgi:hypothetical protein